MSLNVQIWHEPEVAHAELERMGLNRDIFGEAFKRMHRHVLECTENDVLMTPGYLRYAKTLRYLRDLLKGRGWAAVNGKLPTVEHRDLKISITVGSGDHNTGNHLAMPSTKYPRGAASLIAIAENGQLVINFPEWKAIQDAARKLLEMHNAKARGEIRTWWLLLYPTGNHVRAELSLPVQSKGRKITAWEKRIILGTFDLGAGVVVPEVRSYDEGPAIEIDIEAREA